MKPSIGITGASGFIGSHLTENLLKKGHRVKALVKYNSNNFTGWLNEIDSFDRNNLEIKFGDIRDYSICEDFIKGCDVVFNLAALIGIPYSYLAPESYFDVNVKGTLNLLKASNSFKIKKFIQFSTSEVYGTPDTVPIKETHPLNAQSPYAASKIASDQLALSFYNSFKLPIVIIRPFNVFGPRQSERAVISSIINQILSCKNEKIRLGSLWPERDFNYVEDSVESISKVIEPKNIDGQVINIGSGFKISIGEVAKIVMKITNKQVKILEEKKRIRPKESEVKYLQCDNQKSIDMGLYKKNCNSKVMFENGIEKTIDWFRKKIRMGSSDYQI